MIADYSGLNFNEVIKLNICDYLQLRRDSYIYRLEQSEKGQKYLNSCWRMEQTEPEVEKLRDKYSK